MNTEVLRRKTRQIFVGKVPVGGDAPVAVQSMTDTLTTDITATTEQIRRLEAAGCEIVRVAIPDIDSVGALKEIKKEVSTPLIADIHFDYRLALAAIDAGADGIRINPGNIGSREKVKQVLNRAGEAGVPIRIGVNSGSLEKDLEREQSPMHKLMVASVLRQVELFESMQFYNMKIALKSPDIMQSVLAYREISKLLDYPLHIGITEAGGALSGVVNSAMGIGMLLADGIGDTLRVSLTADPVEEIKTGWAILKGLGVRERGIKIISCPTCARKEFDVASMASRLESALGELEKPVTISLLGCVVNGIGEGKHADIGIAGGRTASILFKHGQLARKIANENIVETIIKEVETML